MADNVTIPLTGSGDATAVVATDEVGGAQHQYVKLEFGADGTATKVSSSDPLPVTVAGPLGQALAAASVPVVLPAAQITTLTPPAAITGFATSANQTTIIGHVDGIEALLTTIDADTGALAAVDFATGADVATLLTDAQLRATPVPVSMSGGATAANQATEIASLASIDGKVPALGQALAAGSLPVVLTAAQEAALTPPAAITGFATSAKQDTAQTSLSSIDTKLSTIDGRVDGVEASLSSLDTKTPALGQALAAASVPVVLTAAQVSTLTPPAAITGFATEAKQDVIAGHLDGVEGILTTIDADTSALAGAVAGTEMQVDIVAALPAGTNNIGDVDVLSLPGVAGDIAHDAADSGNPIKIGAKAVAHGTNPTAVAAADRTDLYANRHGVLFVMGGHPNIQTLRTNYTAAQTDATLVTVSGGTKIVVTKVSVLADKANTVDVQVRIGFGATTTPTGAGVVLTHPGIAAGSGVIEGAGGSILGVGADGEDLRITSEVPTTGSIDVLVTYYTIES